MEAHQCLQKNPILTKKQIHVHIILDFPEIDMTSILRSLPACFVEEHQRGGKADSSTFTLQARFQMSFSKAMIVRLILVLFQR